MRPLVLVAVLVFAPSRIAAQSAPDIRIVPTTLTFGGVVAQTTPSVVAAAGGKPAPAVTIEDLQQKARERGAVRVIAQIDLPYVGEDRLDREAVASQRAAIRSAQQRVAQAIGVSDLRVTRFDTIPYLAMEVDAAQLQRLSESEEVIDIQEDAVVPVALASSNTVIGAGAAWASGFGGAGQAVAILDTGVDALHPYFNSGAPRVVSEACYSTTSSVSTSLCPGEVSSSTAPGSARPCPNDLFACFHGTHVAGIAAGNDRVGPNFGVARDASIISIQVFSRFDASVCPGNVPCIASFTSDFMRGLERVYELRNDFRIAAANMSLGGSFAFGNASLCDGFNRGTKAIVDNLRSAGIATVISAGNNRLRDAISAPGCISSAISVGATDDADNIAAFSNVANYLSLLAPGVGVTSAVPGGGTGRFNGTSMAAPHVTGMWALMKQANPAADVSTILALLRESGTVLNDTRSGGWATNMRRINASAAIANTRSFTIHNDGDLLLFIASINRLTHAPWITWSPTGPLFLPAGASQTITVTVDPSAAPPGESTTRLIVDSTDVDENPYPDGVYIVVTNASVPTVTLSATDTTATEQGSTPATFTVTRTGSTSSPLTVHYFLDGTAIAGTDFAPLSGNVTIAAGASSAQIVVAPVDDANVELEETVVAGLATSSAYLIGSSSAAMVTIASDDLTLAPPASVVAAATNALTIDVSWTPVPDALSYRVYRNGTLVGSVTAPPFRDATVVGGAAYLYKVRSFVFAESADSNTDLATALIFSDRTLAGTPIRATHFTEMMVAVNALRGLAGSGTIAFTPPIAIGAPVALQHLSDLRASVDAARATLGLSAIAWTDPAIPPGTPVRAVHLEELRDAVK